MSAVSLSASLFRIWAFAGFLFHVCVICCMYFSYSTTTRFGIESSSDPDTISSDVPNLAVRMRYTDILDYERLEHVVGKRMQRSNNFMDMADLQSNLTPAANSTLLKDKHTTHIMNENEMTPTALQSACFIQEHRRRCLLHGVLEYLFPSHTEFKLQRR